MECARICVSLSLLCAAACRATASDIEIPEPMVFDLVRGLGPQRGELEANVLAVAPLRSGDPAAPELAPENGSVAAGSEMTIPTTEGWFPQAAVRVILEF